MTHVFCHPQVWYDIQSYQKHYGPQTLYLPVTLSSVSMPGPAASSIRLSVSRRRECVLWGPVPKWAQMDKSRRHCRAQDRTVGQLHPLLLP